MRAGRRDGRPRGRRPRQERALIWRARKAAFAAMGRIAPAYYVQDGVIPRTRLAEVLRRIDALAAEYKLRVANVFHAGDGNLHPLVCYDAGREGEAAARRGAVGPDHQGVRRRRRLDHRRARRRRRQEGLHAVDVLRGRPRDVPAAALRVRPARPGQPRQGDADAPAVRRGARALPRASARARRRRRAVLCSIDVRRRPHARAPPETFEQAAAGLAAAAAERPGGADPRRGHQARAGAAHGVEPDVELHTTGLERDHRAQRRRPDRDPPGRGAARPGAGDVRRRRADAVARSAAGARTMPQDARRSAGSSRPPTRARCATATAPRATWSSG